MQTRRVRPAMRPAGVRAKTDRAGSIASRNGSAIVTPTPRRAVRRDMCFPVRNIDVPPLIVLLLVGLCRFRKGRPERRAPRDPENQRRHGIAALLGFADDLADRRHVVILDAAA